jgi:beta-glucosidase
MPDYRDTRLSIERRAADLVQRMNLDEKLAQLGCVWSTSLVKGEAFSHEKAAEALANGIGQVTRIGASTGLRPRQSAAFANAIQRVLVEETRLGIPAIVHEESVAGLTARDATQFPQAIGLASTWSPELIGQMATVIREQMRAVGARQTLAPVLDITRDPRWGRAEETYGEDPYLVGRMGVAFVAGIQGEELSQGVVATGKHFLGYGVSEGGLNHGPTRIGPRELREVFARPFGDAIREAGLASVMNAYSAVDGLPCGGSKEILDDLLRGELGFSGVVVADYFTTALLSSFHAVAEDGGEAAAMALGAGLDVELPALDCYGAPLRDAVRAGRVAEELVDRSVRRVLTQKLELGLFEAPYVDEGCAAEIYDTAEQRTLALEIARSSLVLLKNDGDLLPLDPGLSRIAVIGPSADDIRLLQGDYSYPAHLEIIYKLKAEQSEIMPRPESGAFDPGPDFVPMVSLLEGIRSRVSPQTEITVAQGCGVSGDDGSGLPAAVEAAHGADVAIVAVGGKSGLLADCTSGEFRDASRLELTGRQQELVDLVASTGTPTVVVVVSGRVHALSRVADRVPSILLAWLPGEEGGNAVADVLFGTISPAGRLPISLPRHVGQVPVYYNHKSGGGRSQMFGDYTDLSPSPLYPFGHGLSYTRFEYGALSVSSAEADLEALAPIEVALDICNVGSCVGDEVVQLYLRDVVASVTRPVLQLAGFVRIALEPGEQRRVVFHVHPSQLAFYDREMRLVIEPGDVEVKVGASSADIRTVGKVRLVGETREITLANLTPTKVSA